MEITAEQIPDRSGMTDILTWCLHPGTIKFVEFYELFPGNAGPTL